MAAVAELYNHHPDIEIHYDEVIVSTNTHEAGGVVTEKDKPRELSRYIKN